MSEEKQIELEKYKMFIQSAEDNSNKRLTQTNIHLTINLAFIAYIVTKDVNLLASIMFLVSGLTNCFIWYVVTDNYAKRNKVKFDIINESKYGTLYKEEWKRISILTPLTAYEKTGAILFAILYIVIFIFNII